MNIPDLDPKIKDCLSLAMLFWLGREESFLSIWQEISGGDLRPSIWIKFVEDPRLRESATNAFRGFMNFGKERFDLFPLLDTDFLDGIHGSETFVFVPMEAGIISLAATSGSALEAIDSPAGREKAAVQRLLRLALVFGFLRISRGDLLVSRVTNLDQQFSLALNEEAYRSII